jgi:hypothetical protein
MPPTLGKLTIRIPPELHSWLKRRAQDERRSLNAQITVILEEYRIRQEYHVDESVTPPATKDQ